MKSKIQILFKYLPKHTNNRVSVITQGKLAQFKRSYKRAPYRRACLYNIQNPLCGNANLVCSFVFVNWRADPLLIAKLFLLLDNLYYVTPKTIE